MAKETDMKNGLSVWMKFGLWAIGLVFAAGILYNTMDSQGEDIRENRTEIKGVKEEGREERKIIAGEVQRIELNQRDIENLATKTFETTSAIHDVLTSMQKTQSDFATVQAVMSEKVNTLTKE